MSLRIHVVCTTHPDATVAPRDGEPLRWMRDGDSDVHELYLGNLRCTGDAKDGHRFTPIIDSLLTKEGAFLTVEDAGDEVSLHFDRVAAVPIMSSTNYVINEGEEDEFPACEIVLNLIMPPEK